VLTVGFFGGITVYEKAGYYLMNMQYGTFVGIAGALLTFTTLAMLKVIIDKVMH
jgi:tetrahydromethanopterin S-methyltransferase subunit B